MILQAAINWQSFYFLLFAFVACGFALAVVFSNNIVHMAFFLTLSLGAIAGLFFLAGAEFVGAMQFMIYVGGTLVLLIFGVMLTAQSKFVSMKTAAGEWVLGAILGGALFVLLIRAGFAVPEWNTPRSDAASLVAADAQHATAIGGAVTGYRVDRLSEENPVLRNGMSGYLLPFEIVSIHLLVVLIGASYLARTKKRVKVAV